MTEYFEFLGGRFLKHKRIERVFLQHLLNKLLIPKGRVLSESCVITDKSLFHLGNQCSHMSQIISIQLAFNKHY